MERQLEQRNYKGTVEVRQGPNGPMIVGYGAVYNRDSADLGFIERVDPGAFSKTLQEADVRGLGNHDANWLLGRTGSGTMRLRSDANGLFYEIDVNAEDPDGQRAIAKVRRGDWDGSSFSFTTVRDEWNWQTSPPERRLLEVGLIDVGPVTFPAYPDATAAARALSPVADKLGKPVDRLVAALRDPVELRSLIGGNMDETPPEPTPDEPAPDDAEAVEQNDATPDVEERAGKMISGKNMEALQGLHDSLSATLGGLRDLLDAAQGEAPADSDVAAPALLNEPNDDDEPRGLSLLSAQVELRARRVAAEAAWLRVYASR
jgi:hypothetical protein